jgi:predicted  nucleic acid-binding Zn-ribbon protein
MNPPELDRNLDETRNPETAMAFEQLQAEISLLINQINRQPEDLHELYEMLHQKLNELRATGQPLTQDLAELEQKMLRDFPVPRKPKQK